MAHTMVWSCAGSLGATTRCWRRWLFYFPSSFRLFWFALALWSPPTLPVAASSSTLFSLVPFPCHISAVDAPRNLSFISGTLTTESLIGALSQVGVTVNRQEAEEVMRHYSEKGAGTGGRTVCAISPLQIFSPLLNADGTGHALLKRPPLGNVCSARERVFEWTFMCPSSTKGTQKSRPGAPPVYYC